MRSQGVTLNNYSATNYQKSRKSKQPSFKCIEVHDFGASDPRASHKVLLLKNNGTVLFEYNGFLNDETTGFDGNKGFVKKVAEAADIGGRLTRDIEVAKKQLIENQISEDEVERITKKLGELESNLKIWNGLSKNEKKLKKFVMMIPGTVKGREALFMANIKDKQGNSLEKVKLVEIFDEIRAQGKIQLARGFNVANPENYRPFLGLKIFERAEDFVPVKDLAGTGLGVGKKIANHPEYGKRFSKGFYGVVVQTGGGFGAASIQYLKDDYINITTSECSHDYYYDDVLGKEVRLGAMGASTPSVIENYSKSFGITDKSVIDALKKSGVAQMATQTEIRLSSKTDEKAIQALLDTGAYEITSKNFKNTTLKVTDIERFNKSSKFAIERYVNALCHHAVPQINRGANMYVLSGPLAMGLNDRVKEAQSLFGAKDLGEMLYKKIVDFVTVTHPDRTVRDLMSSDAHAFEVVCDKALSVNNNTGGGAQLRSIKNALTRRGEWIKIKRDAWIKPKSSKEVMAEMIGMVPMAAKKVIQTLKKARV